MRFLCHRICLISVRHMSRQMQIAVWHVLWLNSTACLALVVLCAIGEHLANHPQAKTIDGEYVCREQRWQYRYRFLIHL